MDLFVPQLGEHAASRILHLLSPKGPLRVRVFSARRFTFTQGTWTGFILALNLLITSLIASTVRFQFELKPVEGRDRVQIVQSTHVLGLQWSGKDHGEITVIDFVEANGRTAPRLEIRSPGRSEWIRLHGMSRALMQIADASSQILSHKVTTPQTLQFSIPSWIPPAILLPSLLLLISSRPRSIHFDGTRRQITRADWAGLSRQLFTLSQIARVSVEDGDPSGWRRRAHLHQPWLIVAHPERSHPILLASTTDRAFAAQWTANVTFFLHSSTLPRVSPGEYALWNHESPL
jgi:hypothetical protein